jgi:AcrR family transcriptional regulator
MPQTKRPLSRERVLDKAIELADRHGLDALSMRKLAAALGVEAMSLYNHVANRGDLVDAMVDRVVGEIELPDGEWEDAVRRCAISAHAAFVRHPWAAEPAMSPSRMPTLPNARMRYMEWLLGQLRRAGFSPELAYRGYHALDSHILGFTLWELGHSMPDVADLDDVADVIRGILSTGEFPNLLEHLEQHLNPPEGKGEFEFGLDLILDGLKRVRDAA